MDCSRCWLCAIIIRIKALYLGSFRLLAKIGLKSTFIKMSALTASLKRENFLDPIFVAYRSRTCTSPFALYLVNLSTYSNHLLYPHNLYNNISKLSFSRGRCAVLLAHSFCMRFTPKSASRSISISPWRWCFF